MESTRQLSILTWSLISPSKAPAVWNSLMWTMNTSFVLSKNCIVKVMLMLWVKEGRVIWSQSVMGMTHEDFPRSNVSSPSTESLYYWVRGMLGIDQGKLERENISLFRDVLWMSTWHSECSQLDYCYKKREREGYSYIDRCYCSSVVGTQKS